MGILVDEGKIHWNDRVIQYLPDFKLSDPWISTHLTIADILNHRSGLEGFDGDLLWYGKLLKTGVCKKNTIQCIRNHFRSDFGYQNVMYIVAGLIIENSEPANMGRLHTTTFLFARISGITVEKN